MYCNKVLLIDQRFDWLKYSPICQWFAGCLPSTENKENRTKLKYQNNLNTQGQDLGQPYQACTDWGTIWDTNQTLSFSLVNQHNPAQLYLSAWSHSSGFPTIKAPTCSHPLLHCLNTNIVFWELISQNQPCLFLTLHSAWFCLTLLFDLILSAQSLDIELSEMYLLWQVSLMMCLETFS